MKHRHKLDQRHVTARDAMRLCSAWMRFGWDMIARPLEVSRDSGERMSEGLAQGLFGGWAPKQVATDFAEDYVNLLAGLWGVPLSAFNAAVAELERADGDAPEAIGRHLTGAAPPPIEQPVGLKADGNDLASRFLLPARIVDASQAWASWFIPISQAHELMQEAVDLGHQPKEVLDQFEPVSVGKGEAMVTLMATDYRASDFGVLEEIGLTLSVTPKDGDFPDPGQMFIRLIVNDPYSIEAARKIWGIRKDACGDVQLDARYSEDEVRFVVAKTKADTLDLTFPRFGKGRSFDALSMIYAMAEPDDLPVKPTAPVRAILRRSGSGEGVQFGGNVAVKLPENSTAGMEAGCLCRDGTMACLCDQLRRLDLHNRPPAANGWSEQMSGALEGPAPILRP